MKTPLELKKRRAERTRVALRQRNKAGQLRLTVYRSNQHIEAQLIDDSKGVTVVAASSREADVKKAFKKDWTKSQQAAFVGKTIAERAAAQKVKGGYFDRGSYLEHGRETALAEGAREAGLVF
jgi:large subunit ribosomal protein L18